MAWRGVSDCLKGCKQGQERQQPIKSHGLNDMKNERQALRWTVENGRENAVCGQNVVTPLIVYMSGENSCCCATILKNYFMEYFHQIGLLTCTVLATKDTFL